MRYVRRKGTGLAIDVSTSGGPYRFAFGVLREDVDVAGAALAAAGWTAPLALRETIHVSRVAPRRRGWLVIGPDRLALESRSAGVVGLPRADVGTAELDRGRRRPRLTVSDASGAPAFSCRILDEVAVHTSLEHFGW